MKRQLKFNTERWGFLTLLLFLWNRTGIFIYPMRTLHTHNNQTCTTYLLPIFHLEIPYILNSKSYFIISLFLNYHVITIYMKVLSHNKWADKIIILQRGNHQNWIPSRYDISFHHMKNFLPHSFKRTPHLSTTFWCQL